MFQVCQRGGLDNQYATGVSATNPKKSNFVNHEKTAPHREALKRLDFTVETSLAREAG